MNKPRIRLIVNPNADLGHSAQRAAEIHPIISEYEAIEWVTSDYPTHTTQLAMEAASQGYELVIAAGGDGTVHEVVNGLMKFPPESRPRMAVVPLGSGNDFSHAIGVDPNPAAALRQAMNGTPRRVDVVRFWEPDGKQGFFVNTLGIGFDTVVTIRSRRIKLLRGFMIYLAAVIQTILLDNEAPLIDMKVDEDRRKDGLLMLVFCNGSREGGGFRVCPEARPDDGILHYVAIRQISRLRMFRLLPEFMNGTQMKFDEVSSGTFKRIELESDRPLYIHADGEIVTGWGTDLRKLGVELLAGELEVLT